MYENLKLGVSPITEEVFIGRVKKSKGKAYEEWCEGKRNITNNFIQCVMQKFGENKPHTITVNGKPKYEIIIKDVSGE